jgi:hypothetical protein
MEDLQNTVNDNDKRLSVHEAVCAERYEGIQEALASGEKRMQKIEYILYAIGGVVLLGPGFAAELVKKFVGH